MTTYTMHKLSYTTLDSSGQLFAQQAVEKALKSLFFVVKREDPPKFHSAVTELYRNLKDSGFSLPQDLEKHLFILNKYYTISRYPDAANGLPSDSVDEVEAQGALDLARGVVDHAKEVAEKRFERVNKLVSALHREEIFVEEVFCLGVMPEKITCIVATLTLLLYQIAGVPPNVKKNGYNKRDNVERRYKKC